MHGSQANLCSIDQGSNGGNSGTCVAVPPPRSRSVSRIRTTDRFDAMNPARNNDFLEQPSALSMIGGQVTREATATTSLLSRELSSSLQQHQTSRHPPRFQNQASRRLASPPFAVREEKVHGQIFVNGGTAVDTSAMADAGAYPRPSCDIQTQATRKPRSRSHSRVIADAVRESAGAPREAAVRQAHLGAAADSSFRSVVRVVKPSLLLDAANQGAKAAPAEQSSNKRLSIRQPPKSWDDKVKSLADKVGDKFEEC